MSNQGERLTREDVLLAHCLRAYGYTLFEVAAFFGWSRERTRKAARLFDHPICRDWRYRDD